MKIYVVLSEFDVYNKGYAKTEKAFYSKQDAELYKAKTDEKYNALKANCDDKYIHQKFDDVTEEEHEAYKWEETRIEEIEII